MSLSLILELVAPFYIDTLQPVSYYKTHVPHELHAELHELENTYISATGQQYVGIGADDFCEWVVQLIRGVDPEFIFIANVHIANQAEEWWMKQADMICGIMDTEN